MAKKKKSEVKKAPAVNGGQPKRVNKQEPEPVIPATQGGKVTMPRFNQDDWQAVVSASGRKYDVRYSAEHQCFEIMDADGIINYCKDSPFDIDKWEQRIKEDWAFLSPVHRTTVVIQLATLADAPLVIYDLGHNHKIFPTCWRCEKHLGGSFMLLLSIHLSPEDIREFIPNGIILERKVGVKLW